MRLYDDTTTHVGSTTSMKRRTAGTDMSDSMGTCREAASRTAPSLESACRTRPTTWKCPSSPRSADSVVTPMPISNTLGASCIEPRLIRVGALFRRRPQDLCHLQSAGLKSDDRFRADPRGQHTHVPRPGAFRWPDIEIGCTAGGSIDIAPELAKHNAGEPVGDRCQLVGG